MKTRPVIILTAIIICLVSSVQAQEITDAAKEGNLERVRELVTADLSLINIVDQANRTPLHWAARGVHFETLEYLVGQGADVNAQDVNLVTPFHSVCSRGHLEAARILLEHGADLGLTMYDRATALHAAVSSGSLELVMLLVDKGAPLDVKDEIEDTPLHTAAHAAKWEMVDYIVRHPSMAATGVLNTADFDGNTILHLASAAGNMETVTALVSKAVDYNLRNARGQSAYNLAVEAGHREIADYLADNGADRRPQMFPELIGPYLGQTPPDTVPLLFAKGIVSTRIGMYGTIVFAPDGREAFWKPEIPQMYYMKMEGDRWGAPTVFPYDGQINVPFYSIDGDRLYVMVKPGKNEEIRYFTRNDDNWANPQPLDPAVNLGPMHWQFSLDRRGDLYFSGQGLKRARFVNGKYSPPELLPPPLNNADDSQQQFRAGSVGPFISADSDFLVFTKFSADWRRPVQLYVSFRDDAGTWTEPQSLSDRLQTEGNDSAPMITPDGKYLFFQSVRTGSGASRGLYWVSAEVVEQMRPRK